MGMSEKRRHHFIPRFLLARFASESREKKSFVWQFRNGNQPIRISTKDAAVEDRFYGPQELGLEDKLCATESKASEIFRQIDNGSDPNQFINDLSTTAWLLFARTRSMKERFASTANILVMEIEKELSKPENKLLIHTRLGNRFDSYLHQVPREARQNVFQMRNKFVAEVHRQLIESIKQIININKPTKAEGLSKPHVESMGKLLANTEGVSHIWKKWQVETLNEAHYILGDCCLLGMRDGNFERSPNTKDSYSKIFLPISTSKLLIGHSDNSTATEKPPTFEQINNHMSAQSSQCFYSAFNSDHENQLIKLIGSENSLLTSNGISEIVKECLDQL